MTTRRSRTAGAAAVAGALLGVCAGAAAPAEAATKHTPLTRAKLVPFANCTSVVKYARVQAIRTGGTGVRTRVGGLSVPSVSTPAVAVDDSASSGARPLPAPAPTATKESGSGGAAGRDFSTTNVQEAGVDEPDIVKTDGRRLFAVTDGRLRVFDVTAERGPRLIATLALEGAGHQLLLEGDRLLVLARTAGAMPVPVLPGAPSTAAPRARASTIALPPRGETVLLSEVDVSDSAGPVVRRTMSVPGTIVGGRLTGVSARIVVSSGAPDLTAAQARRATSRAWVPRTELRSRVTGRTIRRSVVDCDDIRRPRAFSGLDLLSVLTIDLGKGLFDIDRDAIMAGADTVYASAGSLFVASRRWLPAVEDGRAIPDALRTELHRFDASVPGITRYRSSGSVPGFVLNSYALSEHDGILRVATTSEPDWFDDDPDATTQSFVSTLKESGGVLQPLGRVGGLGRGERIYAVRFIGDVGYVVTFRQVDPLYTVDLSRPTEPKVLGELKIAGYSAYLHPVGEGRLLGVGQDADAQGQTKGTQVSLFDVSDLRNPRRLSQVGFGDGSGSEAEFDPYAFLFWEPAKLALLPVQRHDARTYDTVFDGAVAIRTGATALSPAGTITHPARDGRTPGISRSVVVGDRVMTLSYAGLQANRLDTLVPVGYAAMP